MDKKVRSLSFLLHTIFFFNKNKRIFLLKTGTQKMFQHKKKYNKCYGIEKYNIKLQYRTMRLERIKKNIFSFIDFGLSSKKKKKK